MVIPRAIKDDEVLAHDLFLHHFKNNKVRNINKKKEELYISENVDFKYSMTPNRGGVSLQRTFYCDENICKAFAKKIPKKYLDFIIFQKSKFDSTLTLFKETRAEFNIEILATPLDENNLSYVDRGVD
jgi:hypothetical protein